MTAPVTRAVVKALTADGADVRFVGGCVRDALLGRESADIDIGTPDPPERVMGLLGRAGIESRNVPRGLSHGTVIAVCDGEHFEVTTLRRDERTDGRHAEVAFTDDWQEDAARRDFTINAMSAAPDGALHDYFGGQADLEAGRVRFVGDPATRIAEDHLRLLRFFRFHAWYGQRRAGQGGARRVQSSGAHDPNAVGRARAGRDAEAARRSRSFSATGRDAGRRRARPTTAGGIGSQAPCPPVAIEGSVGDGDPLRRLGALIADAEAAHDVAARWRLAGADAARLAAAVDASPATFHFDISPVEVTHRAAPIAPALDRRAQRRLVYELGRERFREKVLYAWSAEDGDEYEEVWRAMLETAEQWEVPTFPVTGADVLARGIPEGPEVGDLLAAVEGWWTERDFAPDRAALLERLDAFVAESRGG